MLNGAAGIHCVNNLLQNALFTKSDFDHIAEAIDNEEKDCLSNKWDVYGKAAGLPGTSENVDEHGNYSIQVLIRVRLHGCVLRLFFRLLGSNGEMLHRHCKRQR